MATKQNDVSSSSSVSTDQDAQSRTGWWRVSGWKLRNKIALALAFPMVAASWFAVDNATESWEVQAEHEATAGQIRVLEPTVDYLYAAETATVIARSETASNSAARTAAVEEVRQAAEKVEGLLEDEALTENQKAQLAGLVALSDQLRDGRAYETLLQSRSQVAQLHNGVSDFYQSILNGQNSPEPVLQQISYVMEGRLAFTMQQLEVAYSGNRITNTAQVFSELGVEDAAIAQLARARDDAPSVLDLRSLNAARFTTVEAGEGALAYEETLALYDDLTSTVLTESIEALDENAAAARQQALASIAILAAALVATLLFAWLIARLITRPVRIVRDSARDVASNQLPRAVATIRAGGDPGAIEPIGVTTNEEMGQMARAVDELHQTAVNLAQGEAHLRSQVGEMFVTLSRRNTTLINQQLGLIEELERDEQDPRRLESLFRLDHLAARMRRTAESLVILSDAPVRQRESQSLAVSDALQAATAGVQEYQRVEMQGSSPAKIVGSAANDVVHLLTELIDNALSFSPPTESVHVSTTVAAGQTVITISDGGLGLPEDVLTQLNGMLQKDVGITPDAARRMGLFVVSRLAHRHGIDIHLSKNARGGITASVALADHLIVPGTAPAAPPAPVVDTPVIDVPAQATPVREDAPLITPIAPEEVAQKAAERDDTPTITPVAKPDPLSDPLSDPLTDPLEAPAASSTETATDDQVDQINAAISAVTELPKRRPGASGPGRRGAVEPVGGGSLFAPATPATPVAPAEPVAPEPAAPVAPAAHRSEPAQEAESGAAPGLPKRNPGATVPGRRAAVQPTGSSLFSAPAPEPEAPAAPEPAEPVSMFARPHADSSDASTETDGKAEAGALGIFSLREARNGATKRDQDAEAPSSTVEPAISSEDPLGLDRPSSTGAASESTEDATTDPATADSTQEAPAAKVDDAPAAPADLPTRTPGSHTLAPQQANGSAANASGWLAGNETTEFPTTADAGWQAAHRAAEPESSPTTNAGLPQRQPGRRLVPGSVAPTRTAPTRDPEAIRKRLAAHAAGVSRGRTATTNANTQKEGPA
ncbi:hypothetical protein IEQ44_06765 [Nocardioides sp. Y6]|uniref:histidine kinase n=1 Tax=Nocardioides malaquae TaxID=2773426 RepID=A0ABR9RSI6_9ACTN|nr:ATP-binding protein [Nocardioides malaquae]MBE7324350.1 hypothetical protein [Nocardioides malaquae]